MTISPKYPSARMTSRNASASLLNGFLTSAP
jgi:hypothetical protein